MRYAVISDLHANLQAWEAVYNDICNQGVDEIICLGDVVGYGAHPAEVIDSCYETVHHVLMGNHDAAVCGKMQLELFNDDPRQILQWTQQTLDTFSLDFLGSCPLVIGGDQAVFTHACVNNPANFDYVYEADQCLAEWQSCSERLIFAGHTHLPQVHMVGEMGKPQTIAAQDIRLSDDIRYFVNVGSVGQPRDGDPRATYVIYDSDDRYISFRRVRFDMTGYLASLKAKNFPVHPSMLGNQAASVQDFNPLNLPRIMGQPENTPQENQVQELNERFETLTDRREADTRPEAPAKPKKGKVFKSTRTTGKSTGKSGIGASPSSRRRDHTSRLRPGSGSHTTTQKVTPKKSAATPLLLIIGIIILIGLVVAGIMVIASR